MTDQINQSDWVMVPREPTKAMRWAGDGAAETCINDDPCGMAGKHIWADMIAAAPKPPTTPPDEMVEKVARIINPDYWAVLDHYLGEVMRLKNSGYDPDNFKDKKSMIQARAAIAAITEGRGG